MKWKTNLQAALLLLALSAVCVPQTSSRYATPEIRRVGDKLACKCGSCNNTIATCQMLGCGYMTPARERIAAMQAKGASDQQIVDSFVKEMGLAALAVPPAEGFHLLGWIMPFIAILFGLGAILIYWKRFRKPVDEPALAGGPTRKIDESYRQRIERELEEDD